MSIIIELESTENQNEDMNEDIQEPAAIEFVVEEPCTDDHSVNFNEASFLLDTSTDEKNLETFADTFVYNPNAETKELKVRLDKFLWAARFFKTRAVARAAVENGQVFYEGKRAKPSLEVQEGAIINLDQYDVKQEKVINITARIQKLSTRRRNSQEASELFEIIESKPVQRTRRHQQNRPFTRTNNQNQQKSVRYLRRPGNQQQIKQQNGYNHEYNSSYNQPIPELESEY